DSVDIAGYDPGCAHAEGAEGIRAHKGVFFLIDARGGYHVQLLERRAAAGLLTAELPRVLGQRVLKLPVALEKGVHNLQAVFRRQIGRKPEHLPENLLFTRLLEKA